MAFGNDRFNSQTAQMTAAQARAAQMDVGMRRYMLQVYNYMASGVLLTGIIAYFSASTPAVLNLLYAVGEGGRVQPTMLAYVAMFSPLAFVLVLNMGIHRMKASTAQAVFWAFSAVMGLSLAHIFLTFTGASVARVFFITAGAFAGLSLYGYTTKKDLSGFGTFLMMGLIGIIIASVVNIFLASGALHFVISVVGVLVFAGLTAWDTQRIKSMYLESDNSEVSSKKAVLGATSLYLNFINMFMMLLSLFGNRE